MPRVICQVHFADRYATFRWSASGRFFPPYRITDDEYRQLQAAAGDAREALAMLSQAKDDAAKSDALLRLAETGSQLYALLFPETGESAAVGRRVRRWLRDLYEAHELEGLEIVSNDPGRIPWPVIFEGESGDPALRTAAPGDAVWRGFWGTRYDLTTAHRYNPRRRRDLLVEPQVLISVDRESMARLPAELRGSLAGVFDSEDPNMVCVDSIDALLEAIAKAPPDVLVHFGPVAATGLVLGGSTITLETVERQLREAAEVAIWSDVVLLLAPVAAPGIEEWHRLREATEAAGFSAVVAPEVPLSLEESARFFGKLLPRFLFEGDPLGGAVQDARSAIVPAGLGIACYGVPTLQVAWNAEDLDEVQPQGLPLPEDPYRPLAPLSESHRPLLAGRDGELAELARAIDRRRGEWVVLHGRAAVGKSSLLRAGVIPALQDVHAGPGAVADADAAGAIPNVWLLRATNDLCGQLALFLCEHFSEPLEYQAPDGQVETVDFTNRFCQMIRSMLSEGEEDSLTDFSLEPAAVQSVLQKSPAAMREVLEWMESSLPDEIVLVVDQCEELFSLTTTGEDVRARNASMVLLAELSRGGSGTRLIAAVRTEYLGRWLSRFVEGGVGDRVHPLLLGGLGVPGLVELLERPTLDEAAPYSSEIPAEKYGFAFAEGAAEDLASACLHHANHHGPDAVALAQVVGHLLYLSSLQKSPAIIDSGDLNSFGGVEKAIGRYIDAVVAEAAAPSLARRWPQLLAPLYRRQPDGLLTANLITAEEIRLLSPPESGIAGWLAKTFSVPSSSRLSKILSTYDALAEQEGGIVETVSIVSHGQIEKAYSLASDAGLVDMDEAAQEHEHRSQVRTKTTDLAFVFGAVLIVAAVAVWAFIIQPQRRRIAGFSDERAQIKQQVSQLVEGVKAKEKALEQAITNLAWRAYVADIRQGYDAWRIGDTFRLHFSLVNAERKIRSPGFEWRFLKYQANPELRTLVGHQAEVTQLVTLSDGRAASLGNDGKVFVWDTSNWRRAAVLEFDPGSAVSLAAAPNEKQLAVGLKSGVVQLVSLAEPPAAKELAGHRGPVLALAYSRDGKQIVSAAADGEIRIWETATGNKISTIDTGQKIVSTSLSGDISLAAMLKGDNRIAVWSLREKRMLREWAVTEGKIHAARFLSDGQRLALAGGAMRDGVESGYFGIWDAATGKKIDDVTVLDATALSVALDPEGKTIALGTKGRSVEIYDLESRKRSTRWHGHLGWVSAVAFARGGKRVLSGSYDRTIKLWDIERAPGKVPVFDKAITHIVVSADNRKLAAAGEDGSIAVIDLKSGRKSASFDANYDAVAALQWMTLGNREQLVIVGEGKPGGLAVWNPATNQLTKKWDSARRAVVSAAISRIQRFAAIAADNSEVLLVNIESGKIVATLGEAKGRLRLLRFSPDGKWLVGAAENGQVHLWQTSPVQYRSLVSSHVSEQAERVTAAAFFHSRPWLVLADPQRGITLWDLNDGSSLGSVRAHVGEVSAIDVAANDATFATAGRDGTVKLWAIVNDVLQHGTVLTFSEHRGRVRSIAFTKDLSLLASAGDDGVVQLRWAGRIEVDNPGKKSR